MTAGRLLFCCRGAPSQVALGGAMKKVTRQHREFWVGTLKRRDSTELGLVVYDPLRRAATGSDYVVLYEVTESAAADFRKGVVRDIVGSVVSYPQHDVESAVDAYLRFAQIDIEAEWRRREAARQAIVKAHQRFLAGRGLPEAGTRLPSGQMHREAHCYSCKSHLDNSVDVECEACRWIICCCGACGCGYQPIWGVAN
jgi:hypothetical protein